MIKILAIIIGKLALVATRVLHFGSGTTFPGLIAQKIDPNIIRKLSSKIKKGAIVITGTNGKTTTAKMLVEILSESGLVVLHNPSGSNLTRGIASALIQSVNILGTRLEADIAVFEVDEATMPEAMTKIRPTAVVVTNLFRDQLDRYGEIDKTAEIIGSSLRGFTGLTTILNADDPLVADLSRYSEGKVIYFGVSSDLNTESTAAMDSKDCVECGHELVYSNRYYGHLGIWKCPNCANERPKPTYEAENVLIASSKVSFTMALGGETSAIEMPLRGLYNAYNAVAAAASAHVLGTKVPAITHALKNFGAAFGRMEEFESQGRNVVLALVKNPTGANQALAAVFSDNSPKQCLFALNDNFADGTDVSWIWDIDFEVLNLSESFFVLSGIRGEDILLRMKYAGMDQKNLLLVKDPAQGVHELVKKTERGGTCYVFPTYTAMIDIRGAFAAKGDELEKLGKVTKRGI